jgi:hypothetical protein
MIFKDVTNMIVRKLILNDAFSSSVDNGPENKQIVALGKVSAAATAVTGVAIAAKAVAEVSVVPFTHVGKSVVSACARGGMRAAVSVVNAAVGNDIPMSVKVGAVAVAAGGIAALGVAHNAGSSCTDSAVKKMVAIKGVKEVTQYIRVRDSAPIFPRADLSEKLINGIRDGVVVLEGLSGAGKTTLAYDALTDVVNNKIPEFEGYRILHFSMKDVTERSLFEKLTPFLRNGLVQNVHKLFNLASGQKIILFIDEIQDVLKVCGPTLFSDFKEAMGKGELHVVGTTTDKSAIEAVQNSEDAMKRRISVIEVPVITDKAKIKKAAKYFYEIEQKRLEKEGVNFDIEDCVFDLLNTSSSLFFPDTAYAFTRVQENLSRFMKHVMKYNESCIKIDTDKFIDYVVQSADFINNPKALEEWLSSAKDLSSVHEHEWSRHFPKVQGSLTRTEHQKIESLRLQTLFKPSEVLTIETNSTQHIIAMLQEMGAMDGGILRIDWSILAELTNNPDGLEKLKEFFQDIVSNPFFLPTLLIENYTDRSNCGGWIDASVSTQKSSAHGALEVFGGVFPAVEVVANVVSGVQGFIQQMGVSSNNKMVLQNPLNVKDNTPAVLEQLKGFRGKVIMLKPLQGYINGVELSQGGGPRFGIESDKECVEWLKSNCNKTALADMEIEVETFVPILIRALNLVQADNGNPLLVFDQALQVVQGLHNEKKPLNPFEEDHAMMASAVMKVLKGAFSEESICRVIDIAKQTIEDPVVFSVVASDNQSVIDVELKGKINQLSRAPGFATLYLDGEVFSFSKAARSAFIQNIASSLKDHSFCHFDDGKTSIMTEKQWLSLIKEASIPQGSVVFVSEELVRKNSAILKFCSDQKHKVVIFSLGGISDTESRTVLECVNVVSKWVGLNIGQKRVGEDALLERKLSHTVLDLSVDAWFNFFTREMASFDLSESSHEALARLSAVLSVNSPKNADKLKEQLVDFVKTVHCVEGELDVLASDFYDNFSSLSELSLNDFLYAVCPQKTSLVYRSGLCAKAVFSCFKSCVIAPFKIGVDQLNKRFVWIFATALVVAFLFREKIVNRLKRDREEGGVFRKLLFTL